MKLTPALLALALVLAPACRDDADGDGFDSTQDCNDADGTIHPDATELCNGLDDNCDGRVDEGDGDGANLWYADADHDGFGDSATTATGCSLPVGYVDNADDCDDANPAIHPGAAETSCTDSTDYNCDGSTALADGDADGTPACLDCNDADAAVFPGAEELCNAVDDDCDGVIDDNPTDMATFYADADRDGYGGDAIQIVACTAPTGFLDSADDCDDLRADVFPGAEERCDGLDNDCNGLADDEPIDPRTFFADADADGFGDANAVTIACDAPPDTVSRAGDCDDTRVAVFPGATERCDGLDNNCDGTVDTDAIDLKSWYVDVDRDGFGDTASFTTSCNVPSVAAFIGGDCDDRQAAAHPGAAERCDGLDNDCDGQVDANAVDLKSWYSDADADGFGDAATLASGCTVPSGTTAGAGDCDDNDVSAHPGATERCDSVDHNCDGSLTLDAADTILRYADLDGDTHGDAANPLRECPDAITGVLTTDDCDDTDATVFSGSHTPEVPLDGIDQDCDGLDVCTDLNCDGRPDILLTARDRWSDPALQGSLLSNGTLQWTRGEELPQTATQGALVLDFNGDGYLDVVIASVLSGVTWNYESALHYGGPDGPQAANPTIFPTQGASHPCAGDFNADGFVDLFFPSWNSGTVFDPYLGGPGAGHLFYNSSTGFDPSQFTELPTTGATRCEAVDLNADGALDLFVLNEQDNELGTPSSVFWGSPTGLDPAARVDLNGNRVMDYAIRDMDADGDLDIVMVAAFDSVITTYLNDGGFDTTRNQQLFTPNMGGMAIEDLNGDGYPELIAGVLLPFESFASESIIYWGSATGYNNTDSTALATGDGVSKVIARDLNHDSYPDLVFVRAWSDLLSLPTYHTESLVYWNNSVALFSATKRTMLPSEGSVTASIGDLNGDGWDDLYLPAYFSGYGPDATTFGGTSYLYWGGPSGFDSSIFSSWPSGGDAGPGIIGAR